MGLKGLYVVYDKVACESGPIIEAKNDAVALRMYTTMASKQQIHTPDFKLMKIGLYDADMMVIKALDLPEEIVGKMDMGVEDDIS